MHQSANACIKYDGIVFKDKDGNIINDDYSPKHENIEITGVMEQEITMYSNITIISTSKGTQTYNTTIRQLQECDMNMNRKMAIMNKKTSKKTLNTGNTSMMTYPLKTSHQKNTVKQMNTAQINIDLETWDKFPQQIYQWQSPLIIGTASDPNLCREIKNTL